jgi:hypothetical protein
MAQLSARWHRECYLYGRRIGDPLSAMGTIDRTKHDDDIAEHVIGGVRLDRGPYAHSSERDNTADDRSQPDRRASERRQWPH